MLDLVERVVEGEVQNVKRSSFLTKHRPRHCSHNPPPELRQHPHTPNPHALTIFTGMLEKGYIQQSRVSSSGTAAVGSFVDKGSNGGPLGMLGVGIYQRQSHFS